MVYRPGDPDAAEFDPDTLLLQNVPGDVVLYRGISMISPQGAPVYGTTDGYPANNLSYRCRFPLESRAAPIKRGDMLRVLSTDRTEIKYLVGRKFFVEGEVLGSYSASRTLQLRLEEPME